MHKPEFISWLKKEGIFNDAATHYSKFTRILDDQLRIRRRDILLVVTDKGLPRYRCAPLMAACYLLAAKRLGLTVRLVVQDVKTLQDKVDISLIAAIRNLQEDNFIVAVVSEKLGSFIDLGSSFKRLVTLRRHRFVLTSLLRELPTKDFGKLVSAIDIDYKELQSRAKRLKQILDLGREVRLVTDKGTCLTVGIAGMKAYVNDGKELTAGGNIPVGEVFIAPRKNMVDGRVVIDGSVRVREGTILVNEPVNIYIKNGEVQKITGGYEADMLKQSVNLVLKTRSPVWGIKRIGELGIGLNRNATVCGPNIINEKSLGTAHIAIGNNSSFGGTVFAPLHLDQVFHKPRLYVDGKILLI